MQTYFFNAEIESHTDGQIFTTSNGAGYIKNNELHITQSKYHFIYKFNGTPVGWYMRNESTGSDIFLGQGACPTAEYGDIEYTDEEYFASIIHLQEAMTEEIKE